MSLQRHSTWVLILLVACCAGAALAADIPLDRPGIHPAAAAGGRGAAICVLERVDGGFDVRRPATLPAPLAGGGGEERAAGELWRVEDWDGAYGAIAEDVEISGNGLRVLVGWNLNNERFSLFPIDNDTPLWEFPLTGTGQYVDGLVRVEISGDGSQMVGGAGRLVISGSPVSRVYKFSASGTPDWTFDLPASPTLFNLADVTIADDASRVAVLGVDDGYTIGRVWVLDSASGAVAEDWTFSIAESSSVYNVAFTAGGVRLVVGCRKVVYLYDVPGGLQQTITLNYDCQCPAQITPGGEHLAVGDLRGRLTIWELDSGSGQFAELWHYIIPPDYYYPWIQTVALDGNDSRVVAGSYQPNQSSNHGYLYFFDLDSSTPVRITDDSADLVQEVSLSANGEVAVAASWGDVSNLTGWRLKIAKQNNDRYTVASTDYPGSFFAADIDDNGFFVAGGTKRVHARTFGSGGHAFAFTSGVKVETVTVDISCTPASGTVPFQGRVTVRVHNLAYSSRVVAGHIDVMIANGTIFTDARTGHVTVAPDDVATVSWLVKIPAEPSVIGDNRFTVNGEDVTPAPYNQPPYLQSGDKDLDYCIITAYAP